MASTINASTSAGLVNTADTSGVLQLQTANTAALTIDASQNATFAGSVKTNTLTSASATALTLQSAGTTAVTVDTSQNVGIGNASPTYKLDVIGGSTVLKLKNSNSTDNTAIRFAGNSSNADLYLVGTNVGSNGTGANFQFYDLVAAATRVTIDSSGNVLVGTTSGGYKLTVVGANTISASGWGSGIGTGMVMTTTVTNANSDAISFNQNATQVGHIQTTSVGTTLYTGTSDSRLKNDLGVATDTSVIDNTVIHEFSWKQNNVSDRGVFAQEAFLVKPHAVYQGDDTVNEDGSLQKPWGVDYSKYVPDLIVYAQQLKKQIQEQQALITQLQADVAALKGA